MTFLASHICILWVVCRIQISGATGHRSGQNSIWIVFKKHLNDMKHNSTVKTEHWQQWRDKFFTTEQTAKCTMEVIVMSFLLWCFQTYLQNKLMLWLKYSVTRINMAAHDTQLLKHVSSVKRQKDDCIWFGIMEVFLMDMERWPALNVWDCWESCWQTLMAFSLFTDFQQCGINLMKAVALMDMYSRVTHVPERMDVRECVWLKRAYFIWVLKLVKH